MRIIFLNCYSGQLEQPLFNFILSKKNTSIFCFQEVSISLQEKLKKELVEFNSIFEIGALLSDCNELSGQSVFIKKDIELINHEKIIIHKTKTNDIGFLLKVKVRIRNKQLHLGNVHGTSSPKSKKDSKIRNKQSNSILQSYKNEAGMKVIGGDFNLLPDTKSIQSFTKNGYVDLIKKFNIKATRNKTAWDRFANDPGFVKQYFSDYCFVSKNVKVKKFEVPNVEISDHLPLILDFEI